MRALICVVLFLPAIACSIGDRRVLLISLDGFRHDLLNEKMVPYIHKFASDRSSWFVNGVKSQMLTVTAANHMSIVSGLREEDHGIIGNYFWDRNKEAMYDKFNIAGLGKDIRNDSESSDWNPIDPIWLLNQRNGGRSTVINWPAGDYERSEKVGVNMTSYRAGFGDNSRWYDELRQVVEALESNNLVLWYIPEPDSVLHGNGFHNGKLEEKLLQLDKLFSDLIKEMEVKDYCKNTDIIITADHGHIQIEEGKTLCVNQVLGDVFVNDEDYHAGDSNIYHSNPVSVKEMYKKLKSHVNYNGLPYRVYLGKDVPSQWHYRNAARMGDIVIEALPGGQVKMNCKEGHFDDSNSSTHGQDPNLKEMRALLVMSGPSFKPATKIESIPENIDLFPLMLQLLDIKERPHHSGNLANLREALFAPSNNETVCLKQPNEIIEVKVLTININSSAREGSALTIVSSMIIAYSIMNC